MSLKSKIRSVVEDNSTKKGKIFDYTIQLLILLSLVAFSIETLPNNSDELIEFLYVFEIFCITVFSIEYFLRILISNKPFNYIFSFYGIIDFLAIIPYYLSSIDLRFLRAFRVFRVFRAFKLIKYNKALNRFQIAYRIVKEELTLFLVVILILLFIVSAGIYFFENQAQPEVFKSIFHSSWWSIVTLTTVGYGDVYPITLGGKIFTFFVLIIGVGVVTVPAGLVATSLSKAREIQDEEEKMKNKN
jgi:voltage-gated potassium channel|tara:strand:+ start:1808 stop:2542 length:735 start_codon:yes stop_codon:yes gene_type:complete